MSGPRKFGVQLRVIDIDSWSTDQTAEDFKRLLPRAATVTKDADGWLLEFVNEAASAEVAEATAKEIVDNIMLEVRKRPHPRYEIQVISATPTE